MYNSLVRNKIYCETSLADTLNDTPLGFVDIGMRGGAFSLVNPIAEKTAILGFEPDKKECEKLLSDNSKSCSWAQFFVEPCALFNNSTNIDLNLMSAPTNHSLYPINESFIQRYDMEKFSPVGSETIKTSTLDEVLFDHRVSETYWGEFIKLDTQGTEYEILEGASRTLRERTVAIVSEVAFAEVYKNQKLFSELELYLRNYGFSFYGFISSHLRSCKQIDKTKAMGRERPLYADAVFFKDPLPGGRNTKTLSDREVKILFVCALLLEYYDFALELASLTWATGREKKLIDKLVNDLSHYPQCNTYNELVGLVDRIENEGRNANIEAGYFVSSRRTYFDYDDIIQ